MTNCTIWYEMLTLAITLRYHNNIVTINTRLFEFNIACYLGLLKWSWRCTRITLHDLTYKKCGAKWYTLLPNHKTESMSVKNFFSIWFNYTYFLKLQYFSPHKIFWLIKIYCNSLSLLYAFLVVSLLHFSHYHLLLRHKLILPS